MSSRYYLFFNDPAPTEFYTLSLHDALPDLSTGHVAHRENARLHGLGEKQGALLDARGHGRRHRDRKSTRLNSSHQIISYAVFCLKKKNNLVHQERIEIVQPALTVHIRHNHR